MREGRGERMGQHDRERAPRRMRRRGTEREEEKEEEAGGSKAVMALVFPLAVTR